jgi:hypothetical protein
LNQVHVATDTGVVTITWEAREQLLAELGALDTLKPIVDDFLNAGTSRPVVIPHKLKPDVVEFVEKISRNETGGLIAVGSGLYALWNLRDDLAARPL